MLSMAAENVPLPPHSSGSRIVNDDRPAFGLSFGTLVCPAVEWLRASACYETRVEPPARRPLNDAISSDGPSRAPRSTAAVLRGPGFGADLMPKPLRKPRNNGDDGHRFIESLRWKEGIEASVKAYLNALNRSARHAAPTKSKSVRPPGRLI